MALIPVILCGGSGTRLWPLSRSLYPKQFMDLGGSTLFGDTVRRVQALAEAQPLLVVCNDAQRFFAGAHLASVGSEGTIILEPQARNTAPAIALAAHVALRREPGTDPVLLVLPSDHKIADIAAFAEAMRRALPVAEAGYLVTFGITPDHPSSGFGYIQQGKVLEQGAQAYAVARFLEKPDTEKAAAMLREGGYSWNSGIFMFRASVYLEELAAYAPDMAKACERACADTALDGDFVRVDAQAFLASPSDSIDYAVMERTQRAAVMPLALDWSDLGSWAAFYETGLADKQGNVCAGDILSQDSSGCYLHSTHRLVAALGLEDTVVVETADAVLVAPRHKVQDVKKIVESLATQQRSEKDTHVKVYRPWGTYEVLYCDARFQVKRITVNAGAVLSQQLHHHRAEHWVVVSGTALVSVGEHQTLLRENQSTYIELGSVHRLENPGKIPLVVIEIQTGSYLGEDDIVRFEDTYGRM